ncbi:hypothetical protein PCANC_04589 [Puccinia coronata f. sp. avenae]|uniref:Uncharacterized protein n=1 Tax=Puccinia coronata f. sp. avenae TaxID=200324 RepID=A0A2N5W0E6_9BASI|nr:hypothetical protein PCASD_00042 [Puccinia coronata f. sp. avenae]PLW55706.1 hypothetical protein PCANC_04589 [Puccinia coronata f. sp. avenae]
MSDDRFTYIHLRAETSLWNYADDQVHWALQDLDDRIDQSAWDMIPPYQNEDDEGILPSHSHPSYPFGNPYDPTQAPIQVPQLARLVNQPLAEGSALLLPAGHHADLLQGAGYCWPELATHRLLPPDPLQLADNDPLPDDIPPDQESHQHHPSTHHPQDDHPAHHHPHHHPPPDLPPSAAFHSHLRTPASDAYRPPRQPPTGDQTTRYEGEEEDVQQPSPETEAAL